MQDRVVIFRGPSISLEEAKTHFPNAIYLPPAIQGDMYRAYLNYNPTAIGLIDGNFEHIPSPWHKEILYLLSKGIKIFGSSSMGALRAAELDIFGMVGIGQIYQNYTDNIIEDDDEVTLLHSPKELDFQPISDAMVDIRQTLTKAVNKGVISSPFKTELEQYYKNCFYKERFYDRGIQHFKDKNIDGVTAFEQWLPDNKVNQKKEDAISLLKTIQSHHEYKIPEFKFENTVYWHNLKTIINQEIQKAA